MNDQKPSKMVYFARPEDNRNMFFKEEIIEFNRLANGEYASSRYVPHITISLKEDGSMRRDVRPSFFRFMKMNRISLFLTRPLYDHTDVFEATLDYSVPMLHLFPEACFTPELRKFGMVIVSDLEFLAQNISPKSVHEGAAKKFYAIARTRSEFENLVTYTSESTLHTGIPEDTAYSPAQQHALRAIYHAIVNSNPSLLHQLR